MMKQVRTALSAAAVSLLLLAALPSAKGFSTGSPAGIHNNAFAIYVSSPTSAHVVLNNLETSSSSNFSRSRSGIYAKPQQGSDDIDTIAAGRSAGPLKFIRRNLLP